MGYSILTPSSAYHDNALVRGGELWLFYLGSSHGFRLLSSIDVPSGVLPSDPDLFDGTITCDGTSRFGFARKRVVQVLTGALSGRPDVSLDLAPENAELAATGSQWRVQPWSVECSTEGDWFRDMLRRQEKLLGHEGILAHTYDTLAAEDERQLTRGKLARYEYSRDSVRFDYEPF